MTNPSDKKITPDLPARREVSEILSQMFGQHSRALYQKGADNMSDEEVEKSLRKLKGALERAPQVLADAQDLLAEMKLKEAKAKLKRPGH